MNREPFTYVSSAAGFDELVERLRDEPGYGLDTEFHRERTYYPHLGLLQVSYRDRVALVDPLEVNVTGFRAVLEGPGLAIIHASALDLEILGLECGAIPSRLFDTQIAGAFVGFGTTSLAKLQQDLLSVSISKASQLTDWLKRPLRTKDLAYAAADVSHLLALHDALRDKLESAGRLSWALDECERERTKPRHSIDPDTAWWRLKSAHRFSDRTAGVAQAVCAFCERRAQALDRPRKQIIPELALLSIVQDPPGSIHELGQVRGLHPRHPCLRFGDELLAAIRTGFELPPAAIRRPPSEPRTSVPANGAIALGMAWAGQVADDLNIDVALLATRDDITRFYRFRESPSLEREPSRLGSGWRHDVFGADLAALMDGRVGLGCRPDGELELRRW